MPTPPPENPKAARARSNIIFSFWAVILFLGLPTWWYTTSIPRAALPIQQMLEWEAKPLTYQVDVQIAAPDLRCESLHQLTTAVQKLVDEQNIFPAFKINVLPVRFKTNESESGSSDEDSAICTTKYLSVEMDRSALDISMNKGDKFAIEYHGQTLPVSAMYVPEKISEVPAQIAGSIMSAFLEEKALYAHLHAQRGDPAHGAQAFLDTLSQDMISTITRVNTRAFKPAPNYHLTFSLFTAGGSPSGWDVSAALDHYIRPLVHSLSATSKVSITTQIQMYSAMSPAIQPFRLDDSHGTFLNSGDLTAFVNAAEWPLSPSIGSGPTINFVLYVPSQDQIPLQMHGTGSSSWIVSQWGGIAILNPPLVTNSETQGQSIVPHLSIDLLQPSFEDFQSQLLMLLGVPSSPSLSLSSRLKAFQRLSAAALYMRAGSNLGSLARLAERLSNIPIPHHVADLVDSSITALMQFHETGDFRYAEAAYEASEKAFFDKSMVGQVYFPDEHKVAVYLPLLGPVGVPLIVALLREVKEQIAARRIS